MKRAELGIAGRPVDFDVIGTERRMACPHCRAREHGIHKDVRRSWRDLDFFQPEVWLHAVAHRVSCSACGKTSQVLVRWGREGSGFTPLSDALAMSLRKGQEQVACVRDLQQKRLLLVTGGRSHQTFDAVVKGFRVQGWQAWAMTHVSMNMCVDCPKGMQEQPAQAAICCDHIHVASRAGKAMDEVRATGFKARPNAAALALGEQNRARRPCPGWAMR